MLYDKKLLKIYLFFLVVSVNFQMFAIKEHKSKFICSKCQNLRAFTSIMRLKQHQHNIHGPGSEPVNCPTCNKAYKKYTLKEHIRYTHGPKIECTLCGLKFSRHAIYKHQRMTHGTKYRYKEESVESISPIIKALKQDSAPAPHYSMLSTLVACQAQAQSQKPAILDPEYEPGSEENLQLFRTINLLEALRSNSE